MANSPWYPLSQPEYTDSPALLVYPDRIRYNIKEMISVVGHADRLVPHIKTHKMSEVVKLQMAAGIRRFKCATIAEAEVLAQTGAHEVLLAYQLTGPKILRYVQLIKKYSTVHFSSLVDNRKSANDLNDLFLLAGIQGTVYIDIDNGMHRTGFPSHGDVLSFYEAIMSLSNISCKGLHVYDGHINEKDFEKRKIKCETDFKPIEKVIKQIVASGFPMPEVIAGGSPTFPIHALTPHVLCSPGTVLLWDYGYGNLLQEQSFLPAAILMTRIISKPTPYIITADLGYKSVAAENAINKRISFLNLSDYTLTSQSEEHLSLQVNEKNWHHLEIGDVLYGIPYHVCPTVALYDEVQVVKNGDIIGQWQVEARRRKIGM